MFSLPQCQGDLRKGTRVTELDVCSRRRRLAQSPLHQSYHLKMNYSFGAATGTESGEQRSTWQLYHFWHRELKYGANLSSTHAGR